MARLVYAFRQFRLDMRTAKWWYRKANKALDYVGEIAAVGTLLLILMRVHPWWLKIVLLPLSAVAMFVTPFIVLILALVVYAVVAIPYNFFVTVPLHADKYSHRIDKTQLQ